MASYNDGLSTVYDIMEHKDQLWSFMASSDGVKGTRCCISSSQQCIQKESMQLALCQLKKPCQFMTKWKELTNMHSVRAGCKIYVLSDNLEDFIIWHLSSSVSAELKEFYSALNWSHIFRYDKHKVTILFLLFCYQKHSVNKTQNCFQWTAVLSF
jgi:hypothetical protein